MFPKFFKFVHTFISPSVGLCSVACCNSRVWLLMGLYIAKNGEPKDEKLAADIPWGPGSPDQDPVSACNYCFEITVS